MQTNDQKKQTRDQSKQAHPTRKRQTNTPKRQKIWRAGGFSMAIGRWCRWSNPWYLVKMFYWRVFNSECAAWHVDLWVRHWFSASVWFNVFCFQGACCGFVKREEKKWGLQLLLQIGRHTPGIESTYNCVKARPDSHISLYMYFSVDVEKTNHTWVAAIQSASTNKTASY